MKNKNVGTWRGRSVIMINDSPLEAEVDILVRIVLKNPNQYRNSEIAFKTLHVLYVVPPGLKRLISCY